MSFSKPAYGRVAGHNSNGCKAMRYQNGSRTNPRGGRSGLASGVTTSNYHNIVGLCQNTLVQLITLANRNVSRETSFTQAKTAKDFIQKVVVANDADHLIQIRSRDPQLLCHQLQLP